MLKYTEQVHVLFGTAMVGVGSIAWWGKVHPNSGARRIWPALCFVIGLLLFIPVDAGTSTYHRLGVWRTLLSVVPDSAAYWAQRWIRPLGELHVLQHKLTGVLAMVIGAIEYSRASGGGRLTAAAWAYVMPVAMIAIGVALGVHGGTAAHLPTRVEQMHHWFLGAGLGASGLVQILVERGYLKSPAWRLVWPIVLVILGTDLVVFYRLPRMS